MSALTHAHAGTHDVQAVASLCRTICFEDSCHSKSVKNIKFWQRQRRRRRRRTRRWRRKTIRRIRGRRWRRRNWGRTCLRMPRGVRWCGGCGYGNALPFPRRFLGRLLHGSGCDQLGVTGTGDAKGSESLMGARSSRGCRHRRDEGRDGGGRGAMNTEDFFFLSRRPARPCLEHG